MPAAPLLRTRDIVPDDAPALAELSVRLGSGETPSRWAALLRRPGAVAVGVVEGDRVVGYAAGEVRGGFGMIGLVAWLEAFGVAVDRRGAGVGRLMLADLLERFARLGAAHVYTLVPVHDQVLAPFFRQVGFKSEPLECFGRAL
jgi:GNAT superfamily N-acetyltransferase